jgi:protein-tyrosine phosphatase
VSRSASLVIAFVMKEKGLSRELANDFVKSKREVVKPNPKFWEDLLKWEKHLKVKS